jgi:hypothetical protein
VGYKGQVIVVPKFLFANQTNTKFHNKTITATVSSNDAYELGYSSRKFCLAFEASVKAHGLDSGTSLLHGIVICIVMLIVYLSYVYTNDLFDVVGSSVM